jgi:hypothetical protein
VLTVGGRTSVSSTSSPSTMARACGEGFPAVWCSRIEVVGDCGARHRLGGARGMVKQRDSGVARAPFFVMGKSDLGGVVQVFL